MLENAGFFGIVVVACDTWELRAALPSDPEMKSLQNESGLDLNH